jgi:cation:H+ antiporter
LAAVVAGAGWLLAQSGVALSAGSGLSESLVGGVFTAVTTSLPELVIALAAVRRGALALAIGDILGGNAFDVLFLFASDLAYRQGSIYAVFGRQELFWTALSILMVGMVVLGLIRRERHGVGNIGFESAAVLVIYLGALLILGVSGGF